LHCSLTEELQCWRWWRDAFDHHWSSMEGWNNTSEIVYTEYRLFLLIQLWNSFQFSVLPCWYVPGVYINKHYVHTEENIRCCVIDM
jgi:hypothetical protein